MNGTSLRVISLVYSLADFFRSISVLKWSGYLPYSSLYRLRRELNYIAHSVSYRQLSFNPTTKEKREGLAARFATSAISAALSSSYAKYSTRFCTCDITYVTLLVLPHCA